MWGALRPIEQLQAIFGYRNAFVYPDRVFLPGINALLSEDSRIKDPEILERMRGQAIGFIDLLIVPVGGLAVRRLLGLKSVTECVGQRFEHDGATAIPLPHPSGASSWLNDPVNRARVTEAAGLIRAELHRLGIERGGETKGRR